LERHQRNTPNPTIMKKIIAFFFVTVLAIIGFAQKTIHDPNAEKRTVASFHAIEVSSGIDLYLSQGAEAVAVSASETRFRDRIKAEVKDGVLKISYENLANFNISLKENKKLKAYVSYSSLDRLKASSGSDVHIDGTIQSEKLSIDLSSGADFEGKVSVTDLIVEQSSGSDMDISGKTNSLKINVSSGSDFNGFDLISETCTAKASSGSDISITVNKQLDATSHSGADIRYRGNAEVKKNKSISSDVRKESK
jgi:hypothetical protein